MSNKTMNQTSLLKNIGGLDECGVVAAVDMSAAI
jgi:hypothetical protein